MKIKKVFASLLFAGLLSLTSCSLFSNFNREEGKGDNPSGESSYGSITFDPAGPVNVDKDDRESAIAVAVNLKNGDPVREKLKLTYSKASVAQGMYIGGEGNVFAFSIYPENIGSVEWRFNYDDKIRANITVNVVGELEPTLDRIYVKTEGPKSFYPNQISDDHKTFPREGLQVMAVYDKGDEIDVTESCDYLLEEKPGNEGLVHISYTQVCNGSSITKETQYNVTILETSVNLDHIYVHTNPTKMIYELDEEFNPAGMVVMAVYDDDNLIDITSSCTFEFDSSEVGEKVPVRIVYHDGGLDVDFDTVLNVQVVEEILDPIAENILSQKNYTITHYGEKNRRTGQFTPKTFESSTKYRVQVITYTVSNIVLDEESLEYHREYLLDYSTIQLLIDRDSFYTACPEAEGDVSAIKAEIAAQIGIDLSEVGNININNGTEQFHYISTPAYSFSQFGVKYSYMDDETLFYEEGLYPSAQHIFVKGEEGQYMTMNGNRHTHEQGVYDKFEYIPTLSAYKNDIKFVLKYGETVEVDSDYNTYEYIGEDSSIKIHLYKNTDLAASLLIRDGICNFNPTKTEYSTEYKFSLIENYGSSPIEAPDSYTLKECSNNVIHLPGQTSFFDDLGSYHAEYCPKCSKYVGTSSHRSHTNDYEYCPDCGRFEETEHIARNNTFKNLFGEYDDTMFVTANGEVCTEANYYLDQFRVNYYLPKSYIAKYCDNQVWFDLSNDVGFYATVTLLYFEQEHILVLNLFNESTQKLDDLCVGIDQNYMYAFNVELVKDEGATWDTTLLEIYESTPMSGGHRVSAYVERFGDYVDSIRFNKIEPEHITYGHITHDGCTTITNYKCSQCEKIIDIYEKIDHNYGEPSVLDECPEWLTPKYDDGSHSIFVFRLCQNCGVEEVLEFDANTFECNSYGNACYIHREGETPEWNYEDYNHLFDDYNVCVACGCVYVENEYITLSMTNTDEFIYMLEAQSLSSTCFEELTINGYSHTEFSELFVEKTALEFYDKYEFFLDSTIKVIVTIERSSGIINFAVYQNNNPLTTVQFRKS